MFRARRFGDFIEAEVDWVTYRRSLFADDGSDDGGGGAAAATGGDADDAGEKGADDDAGAKAAADGDDRAKSNGKDDAPDWREPLNTAERKYADQFASPADAARKSFEQRKLLSTALVQPGADTSDEDRAAYWAKLGRPAEAGAYEIAAPDDLPDHLKPGEADEDRMTRFRDAMFNVNAPSDVVSEVMAFHYAELAEAATAAEKDLLAFNEKGDGELRQEWKGEFDANIEYGKRAWAKMPEGLRDRLDRLGIDADPDFKRWMATYGRTVGEDGMIDGGLPEDRKESLEAKLSELEGLPTIQRWEPKVDKQIQDIRKQLWPGDFTRHTA